MTPKVLCTSQGAAGWEIILFPARNLTKAVLVLTPVVQGFVEKKKKSAIYPT